MIVGTMKNDSGDGNDNNSDSDYSDNNFQYQVECLQYVRWKKNGREEEDQVARGSDAEGGRGIGPAGLDMGLYKGRLD